MTGLDIDALRAALPPPRVEEVGPGCFAYLQPDGGWCVNNTGFVVADDGVTLIDTCYTVPRTLAYLDAVRATTDRPSRLLVNTHHHADHTHGNFLVEGTTIVGHRRCRELVLAVGTSTQAMFPDVDVSDVEVTPPSLTMEERLDVFAGDRPVALRHPGPAHTTSDVYAWLPEERLLYAGDLLFSGVTPFALQGTISGWIAVSEQLRALEPARVVPGHGPIAGPEAFEDQIAYLRFVLGVARRGLDDGLPPLAAAQRTELGRWAEWADAERLVGNLHRAYAELDGDPPGSPLPREQVLLGMMALNGGQPLTCLA